MSKEDGALRSAALPWWLVWLLGGLLVFLGTACVAGSLWARAASARAAAEARRAAELAETLAHTRQQLRAAVARGESLEQSRLALEEELRELRETENKIRRFLGLNERPADDRLAHQGGMGPAGASPEASEGDASTLAPSASQVASSAGSTRSGFDEVLAYLEARREVTARTPTLLPAAADEVWLSCGFGWRTDPFGGTGREFHKGIDVAGPWRSPIVAPARGTVRRVGKDRLLGTYVVLQHGERIKTLYGHLDSAAVERGQEVERGAVIGYMGNTGRSTGTHLHYGVSVDGKYVDPLDFVWDRPFRSLKL
ncbi:MAG: M23 family metallopeptidase [Deferrisomatales bacterium]